MPISKVKKEGWCDRERRVRKERGPEEGGRREEGGGREEVFCVASSQGTRDTLHMSTSVMVRSPHSQSNVNLISSGLKASNNPNYSSSFYGHQRGRDAETRSRSRKL